MANESKPLTWTFVGCCIAALVLFIWLRSIDNRSDIHLRDIKSDALNFQMPSSQGRLPLLNETAAAEEISLIGFDYAYTLAAGGKSKQLNLGTTRSLVVLRKTDELYIKDLFVEPGTSVSLISEGGFVNLLFSGEVSKECHGRIGAGTKLPMISVGEEERGMLQLPPANRRVNLSDPFLDIVCRMNPCSIRIKLSKAHIPDLIENVRVKMVSFTKADTRIGPDQQVVSGILSGKVEVTADDLFRQPYALRTVSLGQDIGLHLGISDAAVLSVGFDRGHLVVQGMVSASPTLSTFSATDGERALAPSILEAVIREPRHKSLYALITSIAAISVSIIGLLRTRRSGAQRKPGSGDGSENHGQKV